jgi:hypothetical protein
MEHEDVHHDAPNLATDNDNVKDEAGGAFVVHGQQRAIQRTW